MGTNKNDIEDKVHKWISYAEEDLRMAKYGLTMSSSCPYRLIAYHAQQCAEKYLKAYLVYNKIDFPYTHNIRVLLKLCNNSWVKKLKEAEQLTPFAITTRYPSEDEEVTKKEAQIAIKIAEMVKQKIKKALTGEGFKL